MENAELKLTSSDILVQCADGWFVSAYAGNSFGFKLTTLIVAADLVTGGCLSVHFWSCRPQTATHTCLSDLVATRASPPFLISDCKSLLGPLAIAGSSWYQPASVIFRPDATDLLQLVQLFSRMTELFNTADFMSARNPTEANQVLDYWKAKYNHSVLGHGNGGCEFGGKPSTPTVH